MDYKTILVHVDQSRHAPARIHLAATLAREHGAHLIGVAMTGLPRAVFPDGAWPIPQTLAASCFEPLYDQASRALAQFGAITAGYPIDCEQRLVTDQDADALILLARFADLVVITQDDPDEALPGQVTRLPDELALHASAPVLIVPRDCPASIGRQILVAWNGSAACARAVHAALPLLQHARHVRMASFCAPTNPFAQDCAAEQAQLAASLARHGVQAHACVREHDVDAGHAILALIDETGSDLVVMGCYGHARFREMLLGGVSRTMLRSATVALLMLH